MSDRMISLADVPDRQFPRDVAPPWRAAAVGLVGELAADLGRLRRLVSDGYSEHLVDRLGSRLEILDSLLAPTAGVLHREGLTLAESLSTVDQRAAELVRLLGKDTR